MSLLAVLLIVVLIAVLWGALPAGNYPAAPSWLGLVVVVLVVFLLLNALGVVHV